MAPLLHRSFLTGREYFVLRSERAQMVLQADQADLSPAFMYVLFDARNSVQSYAKASAFNYGQGEGFVRSALEVLLGGYPFTAVGHETQTRWMVEDGIPAAEAVWWAGGLKVTEKILALDGKNAFLRRIELKSADLAGAENVKLRLSLPPGESHAARGMLIQRNEICILGLGAGGSYPVRAIPQKSELEIGPVPVRPGQTVVVNTILLAHIGKDNVDKLWEPALSPHAGATEAPDFELANIDLGDAIPRTRAAWTNSSRVETQDKTVQEIYDKARFGLRSMVADNGEMNAGIFEYGAQWVRDTSNTLLGVIHAGEFELARRGLEHVLKDMVEEGGNTLIGGAFAPSEYEQFDQMGELMHALKAYRDWTGDDSLIREHRAKLLAMIERYLQPQFRGSNGMMHNKREFWERTLVDGYELAYQTYLILGLREAAALAVPLKAEDRANRWLQVADEILKGMLHHPTHSLVEEGRLIKRRGVDGSWVKYIDFPSFRPEAPRATESVNLAEPDATMALPIAFRIVDPKSKLSRKTLDHLEKIWSARWFGGGYERYHSSGQCDQPGPWPFASCFIMRGQHEAGLYGRSRRTLEWLNRVQGGRTGSWFEEIPLNQAQIACSGVLPWTSGEVSLFVIRHLLGISFEGDRLTIKPALYPGSPAVKADLRFRHSRLKLTVNGSGPMKYAEVNGKRMKPGADGVLRLPKDFRGGTVTIHTAKL
ncbi:MAG: hypothetical protein Q7T82_13440 [Armatimonadota bacterium]|nr:hypothetical protein [Armatimonadota bacterium]